MACKTCNGTAFVAKIPDRPELQSGCDDLECTAVQPETQKHNAAVIEEQKRQAGIK